MSDHYLIYTVINGGSVKKIHKTIKCRSYKDFNEADFASDLSLALDYITAIINDCNNVLFAWELFRESFLAISDIHAPYRNFRVKESASPWITHDIVKLIKERDKLHKTAITEKDPEIFDCYHALRNTITSNIRLSKKAYISNMAAKLHNSKNLWKAVALATGKNVKNDPVPCDLTSSDMNNYFSNIGKRLNEKFGDDVPINWKGPSSSHTFYFTEISTHIVQKHLINLRDKSNIDILMFDAKLLFISAGIISNLLSSLFNLSLQQGMIPSDWKKARVTPIYKGKGPRSDSTNYRPISVICHIAKIFERCVQSQLLEYLETYQFTLFHVISPDQSVFCVSIQL
jgi:hypothetical protein